MGIAVSAGLCTPALAQQVPQASTSASAPAKPFVAPEAARWSPTGGTSTPANSASPAPLQLRDGAVHTGLHGFYDYQSNGMVHGRLYVSPTDPNKIYTVYMLALDGSDTNTIQSSRRVGYAYSTDGGATWQATREIDPGFRLGFPYLDVTAAGVPYIAVHGDPDGQGTRSLMYTGSAGSTTFTRTGTFERLSFTGRSGDGGAGVIWPAFVINPSDPTKQATVATLSFKDGEDPEPIHAAVSPIGKSGPWNIISEDDRSTSSGGRNVLARSAGGKIGLAYYHYGTGAGIYYTQSSDGGASWSTPVLALNNNLLSNGDSVSTSGTLDLAFNGEEPVVAGSGFSREPGDTTFRFVREGIFTWTPSKGVTRAALTDPTKALGIVTTVAVGNLQVKQQPSYPEVGYPTISVGDDGRHIVVAFSAMAQLPEDDPEFPSQQVLSEDGFYYIRLWAVGSSDGGATWGSPRLVQDFAGTTTDSASIEYPVASPWGHVHDNNFDFSVVYQARRNPGMYAFIINDVDPNTDGDQPADRGPIEETYQYFQRKTFDPTFFGEPASVGGVSEANGSLAIVQSFPNPATGSFTVSYKLPTSGAHSLKVYNTLGTEVLSVVDGENGYNGGYTRTFDVSGLASGQYRVLLTQNGRSVSQPLTIVR
jgi:hypothetical protein